MSHHGKAGNGWRDKADKFRAQVEAAQIREAGLRELLAIERAEVRTLKGYVEKRDAAIRLYEDGNAVLKQRVADLERVYAEALSRPPFARWKLPDERWGDNLHMRVGPKGPGGLSPHVHVNRYPLDYPEEHMRGLVGELWIELDDSERHLVGGGFADAAATFVSVALQRGAPLEELAWKLVGLRGGIGGPVWQRADEPPAIGYEEELKLEKLYIPDPDVSRCTSVLDAIGKKLLVRYCSHDPFGPRVPTPDNDSSTEETEHV